MTPTDAAAGPLEENIRGLLIAFCIALIVFGIAIRFTNLDRKFYTNDEATASLHVAGYTIAEYAAAVFDGRARTVDELLAFQRPGRAATAKNVVTSLASEDPQHPPLFYLAERVWTQVAGSGVAARRGLSALLGSVAIAATAWLAWELFGSAAAALACATLVAISPFHILYAQQTREYALWTLLFASASALLLAALRQHDGRVGAPLVSRQHDGRVGAPLVWAGYGLALALGLYADVLFLPALVAHAAYVAVRRPRRGAYVGYAVATLGALAAFSPWLGPLWRASRAGVLTNNTFLGAAVPAKVFVLKWVFNTGAVFFDLDYRWHALAALLLPLLLFVVAAVVALIWRTPVRVWAFVATAALTAGLSLIVPDLVRHESRSTSARYLVPLWVSLELAVGWYLAALLRRPGRARALGLGASLGLACAGVASGVVASGAAVWWGDSSVASLLPVARRLAAEPAALVAYRATWTVRGAPGDRWDFGVVQLADMLPGTIRFRQFPETASPESLVAPGTTFVLDPTEQLMRDLAARGRPLVAVETGQATGASAVESLRAEAQRARAAAGVFDFQASLWRPGPAT